VSFEVGREVTIKAIERSSATTEKTVFICSQKELEKVEVTPDDLYTVGTVAVVKQVLKSNGSMRVVCHGLYRAKARSIQLQDGCFYAVTDELLPVRSDDVLEEAYFRTAKSLVKDKEVIVIPTKTVPQGITAIINFVPDMSAEENEEVMLEEIKNVKTGQVTYAVRDTNIDGKEIHTDDIMGIGDAGILSVGTEIEATTLDMLAQIVDEDSELISIYYGADVSEEDAEALTAKVEELYPDVDVDTHSGGQPIYYYVLAVE
jgi:dihydroxyacetone kinase-like predicted kinase